MDNSTRPPMPAPRSNLQTNQVEINPYIAPTDILINIKKSEPSCNNSNIGRPLTPIESKRLKDLVLVANNKPEKIITDIGLYDNNGERITEDPYTNPEDCIEDSQDNITNKAGTPPTLPPHNKEKTADIISKIGLFSYTCYDTKIRCKTINWKV